MVSNTLLRPFPPAAAPAPGITEEELARATARERRSQAFNTSRNYGRAMAAFDEWCRGRGIIAMPATVGAIKVYLDTQMEELGWKPATVRGAFSAIKDAHRRAGHGSVVMDPSFKDFLAAVEREDRRRQRQARPFREADMCAVRGSAFQPRKVRGCWETAETAHARGLLDVAVLQVMRDGLLRVGEAADLRWEDVGYMPDGPGLLHIRSSKTDQMGEGTTLLLSSRAALDLKALSALSLAEPDSTVFGLSARQLARRIQQACKHAGLGGGFSGHSTRVGMSQDLSGSGSELPELMDAGRWKSSGMVSRYTSSQEARRGAVAKYYGIDPDSLGRLASQPEMEGL